MAVRVARNGYVTHHGDIVCERCSQEDDERYFGESDTPQHCVDCEAIIPIPLTPAGYDYIVESVLEHLASGRNNGRTTILRAWVDRYPNVLYTGIVDAVREDLNRVEIADIIYGALQ